MGKQINQYTKTRTAATIQPDDLLDFDSTEDSGSTFESAKITWAQFIIGVNNEVNNIYSIDGQLAGNRQVDLNSLTLEFINGDTGFGLTPTSGRIHSKSDLAGNSLFLEDSSGTEAASVDDNRFFSINGASQLGSEFLGVSGMTAISSGLGVRGASPLSSVGVNNPLNTTALGFNNLAAFLQNSGVVTMRAVSNNELAFAETAGGIFGRIYQTGSPFNTEFELNGFTATSGLTERKAQISMNSNYWDGVASQTNNARIIHEADSTGGSSHLDFEIKSVVNGSFDDNTTAGETRFLIYDVDNATLERVSVGAADSGGAGFKVLRISN